MNARREYKAHSLARLSLQAWLEARGARLITDSKVTDLDHRIEALLKAFK